MQKQDDMIAEKTVKEGYQESQENQPERKLEIFMPPTKPEWYIRDILSTIDRLQGVLSQEDLWRDQAVTMCVDRIGRDAERLEQYVLYPTETKNNVEGGTDMSEIIKPEGMCVIRREEAAEAENLTDQEPAKEEAEAPVLALCQSKEYVLDQRISLEMPETDRTWTPEDGLDAYLSESGAYVWLVLRLEDGLELRDYAEQLLDFLNSLEGLNCNLLLQARANKAYLIHLEVQLLDGFDASAFTVEELEEDMELCLSMGSPR